MSDQPRKMSIETLNAMTRQAQKIVMVTVYDYPSALIVEEAGTDIAFVGDSLAMLVLGYPSTVPVSLDEMLVFMKAVSRGTSSPLLLGDMPFGSYLTMDDALHTAGRILKEGGMDAVKLEGGRGVADVVKAINDRGISVMGHIGLTPQTSGAHGGYRVQGRRAEQARRLVDDAVTLEDAGAFAIVLELVPAELAEMVSERLSIPTIGIGSGAACDGQVLVWHDLLGLSGMTARHVKRYTNLRGPTLEALRQYADEVRSGAFPGPDHSWHMAQDELGRLADEWDNGHVEAEAALARSTSTVAP